MGSLYRLLLVPAALFLGEPQNGPGVVEGGLFCDTVELVEFVVRIADRGGDPQRTVSQINQDLDRRACLYKIAPEVLMQPLRFERNIAANGTTYAIYQVEVAGLGHQTSEIGDLVFRFASPVVMYTLRNQNSSQSLEHRQTIKH